MKQKKIKEMLYGVSGRNRKTNVRLLLAAAAMGLMLATGCSQAGNGGTGTEMSSDSAKAELDGQESERNTEETETETGNDTAPAEMEETTAQTPAAGEEELPGMDEPAAMPEEGEQAETLYVYGAVTAVTEDQVTIENSMAEGQELVLQIGEDTLLLDAVNAEARTTADLKEGEVIYAYVSRAMTRSLPPITNAAVIFCQVPADFAAPQYAGIRSIEQTENGVSVETDRDMIYHISEETEMGWLGLNDTAGIEDLKEGAQVIAWYSIVMESFPAQTAPERLLILPEVVECGTKE